MIARRHIIGLGVSQVVCWGVSFYAIGVLGDAIGAELGWPKTTVHGAFSAALLMMGLVSPFVGRAVDAYGGRVVLSIGSVLLAVGCLWLSTVQTLTSYYCAWVFFGIAMRCCLYDAAFAALARIAGPEARRPISQITLLGGLSATCFWPIGQFLSEWVGWRGTFVFYAGFALLTLAVHLPLPSGRFEREHSERSAEENLRFSERRTVSLRAYCFVLIVMLGNALHAGMSAHLISILGQLGLGTGLAVAAASVRGVGQSTGRLLEVVTGSRLHPVDLNVVAAAILPLAFAVGLASGVSLLAAFSFSFFYGVGTGLLTITRGSLPLVLFAKQSYGAYVGRLLVPSFIASAAAPFGFAWVLDRFGASAALSVSLLLLMVVFFASLLLKCLQNSSVKRD